MLITTLPSADNLGLIEKMYSCPEIGGARYNVGIRTSLDVAHALARVKDVADRYSKKLWIDLKGRQLRIAKWADPTYGDIELNHEIEVELPAKIFFRGNDSSNIVYVRANRIFVNPDPKYAVGQGQAVNVIGDNLRIKGDFLSELDKEFVEVGRNLGIHDYMASFFHGSADAREIKKIDPEARIVMKIEDISGLEYVGRHYSKEKGNLMAACDDLMINIGKNKTRMIQALELIVNRDSGAIAASHLFTSLLNGCLSLTDISHLKLLCDMGYRNFMLSDSVSHKHFEEAVKLWKDFGEYYNV